MNENTKSAFIAILGRANVGKSSLLNAIIGQKVAIVSDKPQTTRTRIMGVYTKDENQLVFVDTPGFHRPHNLLGEQMIKAVDSGMSDVDAALLVVDAAPKFKSDSEEIPPAEQALIDEITKRKLKAILVINKIDVLENKEDILKIIELYNKAHNFEAVIPLSAKTKDGVNILVDECIKYTVNAPHYFDSQDVTDQTDEVMICEIIREKMLHKLQKEIPHGVAVCIDRFFEKDSADGEPILNIDATIYCEKESHKGIIIGKNGSMLKKIGTFSRIEIEKFYGIKAVLRLWVKVKEDWRNRQGIIHTFGLD
ncbi:MAG: GTPase Era [Acutalibacteraceae bacterium]|nr:GTPase Era [Acutalibacteraceae bacterium]